MSENAKSNGGEAVDTSPRPFSARWGTAIKTEMEEYNGDHLLEPLRLGIALSWLALGFLGSATVYYFVMAARTTWEAAKYVTLYLATYAILVLAFLGVVALIRLTVEVLYRSVSRRWDEQAGMLAGIAFFVLLGYAIYRIAKWTISPMANALRGDIPDRQATVDEYAEDDDGEDDADGEDADDDPEVEVHEDDEGVELNPA